MPEQECRKVIATRLAHEYPPPGETPILCLRAGHRPNTMILLSSDRRPDDGDWDPDSPELMGELLVGNLRVTSFVASERPRPFHVFTVSWHVDGPEQDLNRVEGTFVLLSPLEYFRGLSASDSVETWITATSTLYLEVEFSYRGQLYTATVAELIVETDDAACIGQRLALATIAQQLEDATPGAVDVLLRAHGVTGNAELLDVQADVSPLGMGIHYLVDVRISQGGGSLTARLQATFRLRVSSAQLIPTYSGFGVEITDFDGGTVIEDIALWFGCGPDEVEFTNILGGAFRRGLEHFAREVGNQLCQGDNLQLAWAETDQQALVFRCCPRS